MADLTSHGNQHNSDGQKCAFGGDHPFICRRAMIVKSVSYFMLAGICEIGGGYMVWL